MWPRSGCLAISWIWTRLGGGIPEGDMFWWQGRQERENRC